MTLRLAINGFGRIGRATLRALYENYTDKDIKIVAINNSGDPEQLAFLLKHDSVHGLFNADIRTEGNKIFINGDEINVSSDRNPENLPWKELNIDIVLECTGKFKTRETASAHIKAGAKKVLISAPGGADIDATVVYGVNHDIIKPEFQFVSNASCTTNCLAPVAKALLDGIGIERGLMNTIHAYTNDQTLIDARHNDLRRARSATMSQIPTKTGAAAAVGLVLPELKGKLDGFAVRVPTPNVSLVDLTFEAPRETSAEEINNIVKNASEGSLKSVLDYNEEPLVSIDFNHNPASATFDATQTKVIGNLVKVLAWYDNEWGFSNRMIDVAEIMGQ